MRADANEDEIGNQLVLKEWGSEIVNRIHRSACTAKREISRIDAVGLFKTLDAEALSCSREAEDGDNAELRRV